MPSRGLCRVVSAVILAATLCIGASRAAEVVAPSVTELTVEQAAELIGTKGDLELNHLHVLPPRVAELLGRSGNTIMLTGPSMPVSSKSNPASTSHDPCGATTGWRRSTRPGPRKRRTRRREPASTRFGSSARPGGGRWTSATACTGRCPKAIGISPWRSA